MENEEKKELTPEEINAKMFESGFRSGNYIAGFLSAFDKYELDAQDIAQIIIEKIKSDTLLSKYEIEAYANHECDCDECVDDGDIV